MDRRCTALQILTGRKPGVKTAPADVAEEFHKIPSDDADGALRQNYWAWDRTHLGPRGHEVTRDTVLKTIAAGN